MVHLLYSEGFPHLQCYLLILIHGFFEYKAIRPKYLSPLYWDKYLGMAFRLFMMGFVCLVGLLNGLTKTRGLRQRKPGRRLIKISHIVKMTLSFIVKTLTHSIQYFTSLLFKHLGISFPVCLE